MAFKNLVSVGAQQASHADDAFQLGIESIGGLARILGTGLSLEQLAMTKG